MELDNQMVPLPLTKTFGSKIQPKTHIYNVDNSPKVSFNKVLFRKFGSCTLIVNAGL